ncbi:hypothetical protein MKX01_008831 [Papaver californicum]|nr:hypothetical protein MKX01_008831 [Papaver californicum]
MEDSYFLLLIYFIIFIKLPLQNLLFQHSLFLHSNNSTSLSYYSSTKPYPFQSFKICYSAAEFPEAGSETVDSDSHPWPEWVHFIDKLKSKGYFNQSLLGEGDVVTINVNPRDDLNLLKTACLSFARERFDICKEDIETVVMYGCPSVNRKTANSAKRLRAFVELNETDVSADQFTWFV